MDDIIFKNSKWIWINGEKSKNQWISFIKRINIDEVGESILNISAHTRYFLKINNRYAVIDGSLHRDAYEKNSGFYDSINITGYLFPGENTIEILVWHWGNGGRNNNSFYYGGLIFSCDELKLYSDLTTLSRRHPCYFESFRGKQPDYLYGGYNILYNAENELKECEFPYKNSFEHDNEIFGRLYQRPVPLFRFSDPIECDYVREDNRYIVILERATQLMPYLNVEAQGGEVIHIYSDRYQTNGGPGDHFGKYFGHRTEYICKSGKNEFISLDWIACEEIIFEIPDNVEVVKVGYIISEYDTDFAGLLKTNDSLINRLIEKCGNTLRVCMRDNFMDCPDRERGQWIGDVCVQAPQIFYALDNKAIPLLKKAILNFINLRKGDVLVGNVPGMNFSEIPSQSLNAISDIGMIKEYYINTGDREILKICLKPAIKYLMLWNLSINGEVEKRCGDWYWFDHLNNIDSKLLETCWYFLALKFMKFISEELEIHEHDGFILERMNTIKKNFDKNYFKESNHFSTAKFYSSDEKYVDERANALAVISGLADPKYYIYIKDVLISTFNCSAYMEGYVCEALCFMGYKEYALKRVVSRYYNLINNDNSTLWEDFYILGTKNHAWSGSPLTFIYKYFLGIKFENFRNKVIITPDFNFFDYYKAAIDINGKILEINATKEIINIINNSDSIVETHLIKGNKACRCFGLSV